MPASIDLARQRDFTGGLNLRADQFQLQPNESPEIVNMDVDPRGGVRSRQGVNVYGGPVGGTVIQRVGQYHNDTENRLVVSDTTSTYVKGLSSGWTQIASTANAPFGAVQMKKALYLFNGANSCRKWLHTTPSPFLSTILGVNWSDNFAAPGSGNMPIARQCVVHHNHMWLGDTSEVGVRFPSRVRFSHPGQPEAWRMLDWIDLDPGTSDEPINNLVPYTDHLLCFKQNSITAIYGFSWDSFTVQSVSKEVGAVDANTAVATPAGVFFFDWPNGVMHWDGKRVSWKFSRLAPAIREGDIPESRRSEVRLGWADNRLWVSVPWGVSSNRVFVLDPSLGDEGAWVMYTLPIRQVLEYEGSSGTAFVASLLSGSQMVQLVRNDQPYDDFGAGAVPFETRFRTRWFDADVDAMKKRWRRVYHTFWGDGAGTLHIEMF